MNSGKRKEILLENIVSNCNELLNRINDIQGINEKKKKK
jgi:hypothetical protein